jgi:hypothetical protein
MSDDVFDRELAVLLDVEPSGDFIARLRTHVASHAPMPERWLTFSNIAIAGVVVVAISAVIAWQTARPERVETRQARVTTPAVHAATVAPPHEPHVLISPAESRTVQRLLIAARGAAVVPAVDSTKAAADLLPPMPITIAPIALEPLTAAADLQSGRPISNQE